MRIILIIFLVVQLSNLQAQTLKDFVIPTGYEKIREAKGDLDRDGNEEIVVVYQTVKSSDPSTREGFKRKFYILKSIKGKIKIWQENAEIIFSSNYGFYPDDNILDLIVKDNTLIINQKFYSNSRHSDTSKLTFRFQNNDFYLIGSLSILDDTCNYTLKNDLNFSTGKIIVDEEYSSCDDFASVIQQDFYKVFTHKFKSLIKMNRFKMNENKIKIPNSKKYIYY